ncbi:MAG TPA: ABC transporter permease [Verrucomicrobiae bacterium]|nr:ABC transporter permease [Verrucomicrobiae bacterium]
MNTALPIEKEERPPAMRKMRPPNLLLTVLGPFIGLALVVGLFSSMPEVRPYFLTGANFKIIFIQTVIVAIGALGMTLIVISGGIDLSVGSVIALTSVVAAILLTQNFSPFLVVLLAILAGGVIGSINGAMVAGFRMMPFIVTLGMMGIARGIAKWLAKSQPVNAPESSINNWMALNDPDHFFPLPPGVWIAIGLACLMSLVMRRTVFGRYVFAIGSNEAAARLCGIRVQWQKVAIYALAGLFFGLAGLLQLSRLTQGDPTIAIGLELDIIAAVVIGGASLNGGTGSILGSMIGALIMAVLRNGSNQMGLPTYMQEILIGFVIILAVGLDKLRQRRAAT